MKLWRRKSQPPTSHDSPTEATRARIQAEHDLVDAKADLEETRRETPRHRALGETLRKLREQNGIAADFQRTILRGRP